MQPKEGRLQSGEHILARTIQNVVPEAKVMMAVFSDDSGTLDIYCPADLKQITLGELERKVNMTISKGLEVRKDVLTRDTAEKEFDLSRVPPCAGSIRIVRIGDFDARPCRDPHVDNTKQIGKFVLKNVEKVGKDRYRYTFEVRD